MLGKLLTFMAFTATLSAQTPQAAITGVVTDTQGALIPGATVVLRSADTQVATNTSTNSSGLFTARALPIGRYTLTVERSGFKRYVREGLVLTTGQSLELNLQLEIGQSTETINVNARASSLDTRTSDVSQLIESKTIEDMPIGDRRSMNIINITGAAVFVNYDSGGKPNFSLAGGRTQSQNMFIDGGTAQNMRLGIGQIDTDPPVESTSEVKVLSNSYAAEYGGSAGGVIIATTKSGTNRLKGTLFEYLRNEKLDAGNFFAPFVNGEKVRAPLRYNVFGGTVGGPVVIPKLYKGKDRTFFYFSYEGSRRNEGQTRQMTVPDDLQRNGDFSRTLTAANAVIPIFDPATTRVEAGRGIRDPFPGNRIPSQRFDSVARNLVTFWPNPNKAPDNVTGVNNYRGNWVQSLTRDNLLSKVDHNFSEKDRVTARYLYNSDDLGLTSVFPNPAAETNGTAQRHQQFTYVSWNRVLSPTQLNELRFTYGNRINWQRSLGLDGNWPKQLNLQGLPGSAFPQFSVQGMQALGSAAQERRQFPIQQFQIVDNFSWTRGRHGLKAGFEWRPSMNYEINLPTASGAFTFSPLLTGQPGTAASGLGFASFMLGLPLNFSANATQTLDRRSTYWAWFVQDDWTINRKLTLNLGLRWELDTPMRDTENRMNGFAIDQRNPVSGTPGVVRFMGQNGWPTLPYRTDLNNFGPRLGFAYRPFGEKTVVRGGGGISFAHPFDAGVPNAVALGFSQSLTLNSQDNGLTAPLILRNGLSGFSLQPPALSDAFGAVPVGGAANQAVTFFEGNRATGYSLQYNLTVQHELNGGILLETAFVGNNSRKLPSAGLSINQIPWTILGPANQSQRDRPFPQFSGVTIQNPSLGLSNYNALAARVEKRFAGGFNVLATYTFAKFLNNTNEGGGALGAGAGPYSDLYNRRLDYGRSDNDVRNRLTFSSVYEVPFGKGKRWGSSSPLRYVIGDWALGAIALVQTGAPVTIATQVDTRFNFAAGALRADVSRDPNLSGDARGVARWFDTSAFSQPANYRNGTSGPSVVTAPGKVNFDLSLLRNFPLGENRKFQLRGEFFNLFNKANFGTPGPTLGAPGFGVIGSADPGRRVQIGARLVW